MSEVPKEDRGLVRSELTRLAEYIRKNYDLTIQEIRRFLREMSPQAK